MLFLQRECIFFSGRKHKRDGFCRCVARFFKKQRKGFLPSFLHLLVTGDQSSRTHPALLWWPRIRGSLRLQDTSRAQQTRLSIFTLSVTTRTVSELPLHCFYLRRRDVQEKGKVRSETERSVPSDVGVWNANGDEYRYCFVQLMHTGQRCETWFLPVKLQAAQCYRWLRALSCKCYQLFTSGGTIQEATR